MTENNRWREAGGRRFEFRAGESTASMLGRAALAMPTDDQAAQFIREAREAYYVGFAGDAAFLVWLETGADLRPLSDRVQEFVRAKARPAKVR